MGSNSILEVTNLTQQFRSGERELTVLDHVDFSVEKGTTCAIVGPSGIDRPTQGTVILNGLDLDPLDEDERAEVRNRHVGFIFQTFQLVPTLTALENVMVPLELRGQQTVAVQQEAEELLTAVGLSDRMNHYPTQLSGGEQQRVAIARAFINRPKILFADEPTGNLDSETGATIENLLFELNKASGTTLVLVTHDLSLAEKCQRIIHLKSGQIFKDEWSENPEVNQLNR
jgi:putative ABC transport system ATP-binding protein